MAETARGFRQYVGNLKAWWRGFDDLDTLDYKPGWDAGKFWWLYATDYLIPPLFMAGPVTSVSRYTEDHWFKSDHGEGAGPNLWGTERCDPWLRACIPAAWAALAVAGALATR